MDCCGPTRRQALLWGSLAAAVPAIVGGVSASSAKASTTNLLVTDLEVATVTDTSVIITWFTGSATETDSYGFPMPVAADTELQLGDVDLTTLSIVPGSLKTVYQNNTATPYHYAEVTGLEPGKLYAYVALSNGQQAQQTSMQFPVGAGGSLDYPGTFTTLTTPPGKYLFTLALSNDLHFGEGESGIIENNWPPAFEQDPGLPPYPQVMLQAMLGDLRQPDRAADRLLVAGDLTSDGYKSEATGVKQLLDGWGTLEKDYFVTRGNHDRPHNTSDASACSAVPGATGYHDCFVDSFFPSGPTWFAAKFKGLRIIGLDTYDKPPPSNGGDNGVMSPAQFAWLTEQLAKDPDTPTLVAGHHPVTVEADLTTVGKPTMFDLDPQQAMQLEGLYAKAPGVFLHHSGHTHRNKRTISTTAPNVVFQEVAAVKEYPGGFHLLRVFSGGYALNFYKFRDPDAQAWSERSRPEYLGLAPFYTFGNASDRNAVFRRDLSGLRH